MVCIDFAWIQEEHPPCHGRGGRLLEFLERNQLSIAMFHNEPCDVDSLLNVVQRFNERMSMFPLSLSMASRWVDGMWLFRWCWDRTCRNVDVSLIPSDPHMCVETHELMECWCFHDQYQKQELIECRCFSHSVRSTHVRRTTRVDGMSMFPWSIPKTRVNRMSMFLSFG